MWDLECGRRRSKIRGESKKAGTRKVLQVNSCLQQKSHQTNVHKETLGSYYWYKGGIHAKEEESVSAVKERKRRSTWVYSWAIEERIH